MNVRRACALASLGALALTSCTGTPPPSDARMPAARDAGADATPSPSPSPSAGDAGPGDPRMNAKDSKIVAQTLTRVSELRGIAATRPVPGVKLERNQLVARVKEKALREYPPEALRREGQLLQLMGFAPPTFDYLGEMMKLLDAQLEGFYEPKNGTMYLASDLRGTQAQATLAHELVHALQDMKWDLRSRSLYRPGKGDETMALAALAEGDATSLMLDYVMKPAKSALDVPDAMLRDLMKSGMNMGDIESVPHILRTTLIAPYVEGVAFIHALRHKGGWAMVDRAWDQIPTTSEQILHLDKWETREEALAIPAPTARALGEGWKNDDEDTYGELGFALTFGEWLEADEARAVAAGWGGDRAAVWTRGEEIAMAVHERFDGASPKPDAYAERAMARLGPALKKHLGKPAIADATTLCFDRKETGPLMIARQGRDFVMMAGPARISSKTWTSSATCATAKKWTAEIFAQN